jgi:integrase
MTSGVARARGGDPYKPRLIGDYGRALERRIYPAFGSVKLPDLRRRQIQVLIDRMVADGYDGGTIRNAIKPLQVIYRRAIQAEQVAVSPCTHLELPSARGRRERIASPTEAAALIAALPEAHRALWATAMYAGLRRGEIGGLMWEDVDLERGLVHVRRSWDDHSQVMLPPKSRAGTRTVPIIAQLRRHLVEHQALDRTDRRSRVRFDGDAAVHAEQHPGAGARRVGAGRPAADHAARVPSHVREHPGGDARDHREADHELRRPLVFRDIARPLRQAPTESGGGCRAPDRAVPQRGSGPDGRRVAATVPSRSEPDRRRS